MLILDGMKRNGKRKRGASKPVIECRLRLYAEYDLPVIKFIRDETDEHGRTVITQIKRMLKLAATQQLVAGE